MTNNLILRRLRYILNLKDPQLIAIFAKAEHAVTQEQISHWLCKEEEPQYLNCPDLQLAHFLNGLITEKRGKKEGPMPKAEKNLNNNLILKKLKIAFDLKSDEILTILQKADFTLSKHELSAFFRQPGHKHFRQCKDQVLRNFLLGLQFHLQAKKTSPWDKAKKV